MGASMKWTQQHIETVRYARFARLPGGYDEEAVDAYLSSTVTCMRGGRQIPETVVPTAFNSKTGGLGYEPEGVDSLLFVLHGWREQYAEDARRPVASRWAPPEPGQPLAAPPMHDASGGYDSAYGGPPAPAPRPSSAPTLTPALPPRRTEPAAAASEPAADVRPATRIGLTGRDELSVPPAPSAVEPAPPAAASDNRPVVGASRLSPLKKSSVDVPGGFQKMASKLFSMPSADEPKAAPASTPGVAEANRPLTVVPAPELPVAEAVPTKAEPAPPVAFEPEPERVAPEPVVPEPLSTRPITPAPEPVVEAPAPSRAFEPIDEEDDEDEVESTTPEPAPVLHPSDQPSGVVIWSQDQQDRIHDIGFPTARPASSGYAEKEVDNLLDEIADAMQNGRPLPDIEAARFKRGSVVRAAYDADAVDDFLDEVLEMRPTQRAV